MRVLAGVCVLLLPLLFLAQHGAAALLVRTDTGPSKYARSGLQRSPDYQEDTGLVPSIHQQQSACASRSGAFRLLIRLLLFPQGREAPP